jgi:hypothetical protein
MKYPKLGIRYYYNYHDLKDCWNKWFVLKEGPLSFFFIYTYIL